METWNRIQKRIFQYDRTCIFESTEILWNNRKTRKADHNPVFLEENLSNSLLIKQSVVSVKTSSVEVNFPTMFLQRIKRDLKLTLTTKTEQANLL